MITVALCEEHRREIKAAADRLMETRRLGSPENEAISNVMLAYRHLEDASMRLGKAIQALDGGMSVYDKAQVPAA